MLSIVGLTIFIMNYSRERLKYFLCFIKIDIKIQKYGTFAKKIILSYIEENDETEFMENLHRIVAVAVNLTGIIGYQR